MPQPVQLTPGRTASVYTKTNEPGTCTAPICQPDVPSRHYPEATHLEAHHRDAQAADELSLEREEDLWRVLRAAEHDAHDAERGRPDAHGALARVLMAKAAISSGWTAILGCAGEGEKEDESRAGGEDEVQEREREERQRESVRRRECDRRVAHLARQEHVARIERRRRRGRGRRVGARAWAEERRQERR